MRSCGNPEFISHADTDILLLLLSFFRLGCCPCPIQWGWQHQATPNTGSPSISVLLGYDYRYWIPNDLNVTGKYDRSVWWGHVRKPAKPSMWTCWCSALCQLGHSETQVRTSNTVILVHARSRQKNINNWYIFPWQSLMLLNYILQKHILQNTLYFNYQYGSIQTVHLLLSLFSILAHYYLLKFIAL